MATRRHTEAARGHVLTDEELRERPIGELLGRLASETTTLVRQELELAKAEMREKGRTAAPGIGMMGAAGAAALLAAGTLTAFLVLLLAIVLDAWLSALLVGAALAVAAFVLFRLGRERVEEAGPPIPEQTVETVKEDVQWAKSQSRSAGR
jgi:Putative Actinobacterial Holin-X, holin superfamily III